MKHKMMRFERFQGENGDWWWRLRGKNGQIIANSAEGYKSKRHALNMVTKIIAAVRVDDVVIAVD